MKKESRKPSTKRVSVDIASEKHRAFKAMLASSGLSIRELIDWVTEPDVLTQVIEMMSEREGLKS